MARFPYTVLDVFTSRPLAGNALAVVHDADGVADDVMAAMAIETRLSETCFVQAGGEGADYRNRIFCSVGELPFAGHPSLGVAAATAHHQGRVEASYVQRTQAGLQPLDVRWEEEAGRKVARVTMEQGPVRLGAEVDPALALASVGLSAADADRDLPPQVVSTGLDVLLIPVATAEAVGRARRADLPPGWDEAGLGSLNRYVAWLDPDGGPGRTRCFPRFADPPEDPATGSAVGPLAAYAAARTGRSGLVVHQGVEMGRPSVLRGEVTGEVVRVSGDAVILIEGTVDLPSSSGLA